MSINLKKTFDFISNNVAITLISFISIWYIYILWKHRRLYINTMRMHGPRYFPIVGNLFLFLKKGEDWINVIAIKLFQQYSSPIRLWIGPSTLVIAVNKPEEYEVVLNSPHCLTKGRFIKFFRLLVGDGLFTAPVDVWKRHRKMITPTFHPKILETFIPIVNEKINILKDLLGKKCGKGEVDMELFIQNCNLDIICETAMGVKFDLQTKDTKFAYWTKVPFEIMFKRIHPLYFFDFFFQFTKAWREYSSSAKNLHKLTDEIIIQKRNELKSLALKELNEDNLHKKIFLNYLLQLFDDLEIDEKELKDEIVTLLVAGSDTTATSVCFCLTMIALHPEIQQKVYEEVLDVVGSKKPVESEDLPKLQYLERVCKESMRLFPLGPFISRLTDADVKIGHYTVPKGATILLAVLETHRNPNIWKDPFLFDPDRFLPEEVQKRHPYCYLPFSKGPRNCVGLRYGMMSQKMIIASIVREFKLTTTYKNVEDVKLKTSAMISPEYGYKISLVKRM